MNSIEQPSQDMTPAWLYGTVSFSDHLEAVDVVLWTYLATITRDLSGYGKGVKGPTISSDRIANDLGISLRQVKYSVDRLRDAGFVETRKTVAGNEYTLYAKSSKPDTFRDRKIHENSKTLITPEILLHGPAFLSIRVFAMLDCIRATKNRPYAFASQILLANYLGVTVKTIQRAIADLRDFGLITTETKTETGMWKYEISFDLVKQQKREKITRVRKPKEVAEVLATAVSEPPTEVMVPSPDVVTILVTPELGTEEKSYLPSVADFDWYRRRKMAAA